jgi:hypothetical protein
MRKLVALLVLLVSSIAFASDQAPNDVRELATKFKVTMMDCPERIWTNYNWAGLKVAFVYPSRDHSWVWDAAANSLAQVSNSLLPSFVLGSEFNFFSMSDQVTMALNMEKRGDNLFGLGVHEFFHRHGQKKWKREESSHFRGTVYPVAWQSRLYRRMILDNIKAYAKSNQNRDLEKARYWFEKWSTEYSYEPKSTTDGYEGSADYVEEMAAAIAELGCSASDDQIKSRIVKQIQSKYAPSVVGEGCLGLDFEGYEIGSLAAVLLRFQSGPSLASWNDRVAEGQTPLQILLEGARAEQETAPAVLATQFQALALRTNQERAPILDPVIAQWKNDNFVRVGVPSNWAQSEFNLKFFAVSMQLRVTLSPLDTDHRFISPKGLSDFTLKTNAVIFSYGYVCPDQYLYIPIHSDLIRFVDRITDIQSPVMSGRVVRRLKVDDHGFRYLCVE